MVPCRKNASFWKQTLAVFAASLGMFNWGNMVGWTNSATPQLRNNSTGFGMDDNGSSWVGSTIALGGILSSIVAGKVMDLVGRKKSLIAYNFLSLVGWIVIATAPSVIIICLGRFLNGMAAAAIALTATVYVGEMVASNLRGMFGSSLVFSFSLGLQIALGVGELTPDWRITSVACMVPVILGMIVLLFVPESPYYLAWKTGEVEAARPSLNWILDGPNENVEKSLQDIKDYLQSMENYVQHVSNPVNEIGFEEDLDLWKGFKTKWITMFDVKMILIGSTAMMFSMIAGSPALNYYMVEIFEASSMTFNPSAAAIIVRTAEILGTALSLYTTHKMGRKLLLILSGLGMALAMAILGISFSLLDENGKSPYSWMDYLPLIGMVVFFFSFPIGFNSVILVLLGELFSPSIKGFATSVSSVVWWVSEFVTAKLYFTCNNFLGIDGTFYMFAVISVASVIFVQLFIRETKNKTLAEIQKLYADKRTDNE